MLRCALDNGGTYLEEACKRVATPSYAPPKGQSVEIAAKYTHEVGAIRAQGCDRRGSEQVD
jgi:hypothetical protein